MNKLLSLILFLTILQTHLATAQDRSISGKVIDGSSSQGLPGVTVLVKGTSVGTATDADGNFTIAAPTNSTTLVFSFIGYIPQEQAIGNGSTINITLQPDTKQLNEVVVTALGISREAKSLGYATQQVNSNELTKARETNVVNSLAGKVSGVRITSQSGTLGGSSKIIIRGASSLDAASQPIFVIDGLPVDNSSQQLSTVNSTVPQGSAGVDFGNRAGDINPDDIESINVLKGAAATALYGARAKNGAIIITTKKGKKGVTNIVINSSTRFDRVLKLPSFQNEYAQGNQGVFNLANTNGWGPKISEIQEQTFKNFLGEDETLRAYENNVKDFYQTGHTYLNSVAFESGGDNGDFRLGYTNTYQDAIVPGQNLKRNSINLNSGRTVAKGLDVRANLNYISTSSDGRPVQSSNNPNILASAINGIPRTVDINKVRENVMDEFGQQITLTPGRTGNNPYWIIQNNKFSNSLDRFYGNAIVSYKPVEWLTISDNFGGDIYNEFRKGVTRPGTIGALTGNFFQGNIFNRTINNDLIISTQRNLSENLELRVLAGHNVYSTYYRRDQSDAQQLTVDELYTFTNAASVITTNTSTQKRIVGVYGEIGLSYKDFLFLNITGRNDWSSTLPVNNRSYFYPSVSSSFVFTELLPNNNVLSFGKLRMSWANVGSDTDPYQLDLTYPAQSTAFAQYGYGSSFPFNGVLGFSLPGTIPNFNLKPQNQNSYEVGTELRFLNNLVTLDFNYYNNLTSDQIIALSLPNSTGYAAKRVNAGSIRNKGIEIALGFSPFKTSSFTWSTDVNFSRNRQTVDDLPDEITNYSVASGWSGLQVRAAEGEAFGFYGTGWDRDPEGNIVINQNTGLRLTKNDVRLGNIYPDWMMGINNSFTFKNINLGFLIDIRQGGVIYSSTAQSLRSAGLAEETLENRGNIFIDKGVNRNADGTYTPNTVPVQSMQDFWGNFSSNSNAEGNIYDASYVKLREIRLAYTLPAGWFSNNSKFVKSIDIGVEGRNLWIIHDNVPHIDPEVNFFGPTSVAEGIEFNSVPSTRSFGFNVRARF
ncbi:SusC/RagA family TonB-linked outer membrane protein [Adhaeribacter pallidiroseus]|uniref:TonB-dependent receptor SusC n=1 Tax=Adhaeribacter pallidiroseus TaxID=2072847 RepID=A0A369QJK9_9BACT|nr:SusC/RagA family TonB-linked outer membrane protein [Adhaeribacter pallidiroseus]RDC64490.1 TonB-dependent receptor SusC [Adhaeribacter pallidiroseus]